MAPRKVRTTSCEKASAQARGALALYRQLISTERRTGRLGVPPSFVTPEELILPRVVSIAEDYARSRLIEITEELIRLQHPVEVMMWSKAEESAESSWESLSVAWNDWHQIQLTGAPNFNVLRGYVEARNSILHGLGELTRKQMRGKNEQRTRSRLGNAKISLDGRHLRLRREDIEGATTAAVTFVDWLDQELVRRHLVLLN